VGLRERVLTGRCFHGLRVPSCRNEDLSQLSLLFGATWITNAVVFSSIFGMAIAANLIVARWQTPRLTLLFVLLWAALLLSYFVPFSELTQLAPLARGVIGGAVTALPVLFSSFNLWRKCFSRGATPRMRSVPTCLADCLAAPSRRSAYFSASRPWRYSHRSLRRRGAILPSGQLQPCRRRGERFRPDSAYERLSLRS